MGSALPLITITIDDSQARQNLDPASYANDLFTAMQVAVGFVHRTLMSIKGPSNPPYTDPILPVVGGRLSGSFLQNTDQSGNDIFGSVTTNVEYSGVVNQRRGFLDLVHEITEENINDIFAGALNG